MEQNEDQFDPTRGRPPDRHRPLRRSRSLGRHRDRDNLIPDRQTSRRSRSLERYPDRGGPRYPEGNRDGYPDRYMHDRSTDRYPDRGGPRYPEGNRDGYPDRYMQDGSRDRYPDRHRYPDRYPDRHRYPDRYPDRYPPRYSDRSMDRYPPRYSDRSMDRYPRDVGSRRRHHHGDDDDDDSGLCRPIRACSDAIQRTMERAFYWIGFRVATYPGYVMAIAGIIALSLGTGAIFLEQENQPEVLWLPPDSRAERDYLNSQKLFPTQFRAELVIVTDDNVLEPSVILAMYELDRRLREINQNETDGSDWESLCIRLGSRCFGTSLLELWSFDEGVIRNLTKQDVITTVNTVTVSPWFGGAYDVTRVLGVITRNSSGAIVGAEAAQMNYFIKRNETEVDGKLPGRDIARDFEQQMLDILDAGQDGIKQLYYYTERSYQDEFSDRNQFEALILLGVGYSLMGAFVITALGRFNRLQHRIYLSIAGLSTVGMALILAMGTGYYLDIFYGPLHSILALLLLGIGVDDMFVIIHAFDHLPTRILKDDPIPEQVGLALKSAGVSVTLTSLTDIAAFSIGATTVLPALRTFCIYCAIGILGTYIFQITFFVAALSLNRRRILAHRDACLCCNELSPDYRPNNCSQKSAMSKIVKKIYAPGITRIPVKIVILLVGFGIAAGASYGVYKLEAKPTLRNLFASGSYPRDYLEYVLDVYPAEGDRAALYLGNIDYYNDFSRVLSVHERLQEDFHIDNRSIQSWYITFRDWLHDTLPANTSFNADGLPETEEEFYSFLQDFIQISLGQRFATDIVFNGESEIIASRVNLQHAFVTEAEDQIQAVDNIREIADSSGFDAVDCFPYGATYVNIEVNRIIRDELYRNLGLAFLIVAVVTFPLIAEFRACFYVLLAVIMTLVDVAGIAHFIGITIDIVSAVSLILAIGLSVDYAAHVAHAFLHTGGPNKNVRTQRTLEAIGIPVFFGGFSTFLSLAPLVFASTFVLETFFRIFAGIVLFGLFNGLAVLPVILSLIGPPAHRSAAKEALHHDESEEKGDKDIWIWTTPMSGGLRHSSYDRRWMDQGGGPYHHNDWGRSPNHGLAGNMHPDNFHLDRMRSLPLYGHQSLRGPRDPVMMGGQRTSYPPGPGGQRTSYPPGPSGQRTSYPPGPRG